MKSARSLKAPVPDVKGHTRTVSNFSFVIFIHVIVMCACMWSRLNVIKKHFLRMPRTFRIKFILLFIHFFCCCCIFLITNTKEWFFLADSISRFNFKHFISRLELLERSREMHRRLWTCVERLGFFLYVFYVLFFLHDKICFICKNIIMFTFSNIITSLSLFSFCMRRNRIYNSLRRISDDFLFVPYLYLCLWGEYFFHVPSFSLLAHRHSKSNHWVTLAYNNIIIYSG